VIIDSEIKKSRNERQREASLRWKRKNIDYVRKKNREYKEIIRGRDRDAYNQQMREYFASNPRAKIKNLLCIAKKRSEKFGLEFNITVDDLPLPTHCPLLSIKINYAARGKGGQDDSPSIDRIDNSLGYIKGNVWIVSWRANRIKSNSSLEEIGLIYTKLKEKIHAK
jgi:hypothetical protein